MTNVLSLQSLTNTDSSLNASWSTFSIHCHDGQV
jgi:hypothetical protein